MTGKIKTVAILGVGAVGCYFVWGLQEKLQENLWVIAKNHRKERLEKQGICINGVDYKLNVKTPQQAHGVDLLIVATKYAALEEILEDVADIVDEHTAVLCPLNGVDSEEILAKRIGEEKLLYSVMHIASQRVDNSMKFIPEITKGITFGEKGKSEPSERMLAIKELFDDTLLRYHFSDDIIKEVWWKFAFNVSRNLPQAILGCGTGAYVDSEHAYRLVMLLRQEVVELAKALGIDIAELAPVEKLKYPSAPYARYSTLQDLDAGRHTEIEMFSGTVVRLGRIHGVATPCNEFVYHAIKTLEEKNEGKFNYE